jgi:HAD superfamily hydrolase (TIGR01509 family)
MRGDSSDPAARTDSAAVIFDFDGLILDTEIPEFAAWQDVYRDHGCELELDEWAVCIGTKSGFDAGRRLEELVGRRLDLEVIRSRREQRVTELIGRESLRPGVMDCLAAARRLGLRRGIASSSSRAWVVEHLTRFGLHAEFDHIASSDDVARVKPDPALYRVVLKRLEVAPHRAIAFEDSPNGIAAAKTAGLFCVAVPNPVTRRLPLGRADLIVESLTDLSLEELLDRAAQPGDGSFPSR